MTIDIQLHYKYKLQLLKLLVKLKVKVMSTGTPYRIRFHQRQTGRLKKRNIKGLRHDNEFGFEKPSTLVSNTSNRPPASVDQSNMTSSSPSRRSACGLTLSHINGCTYAKLFATIILRELDKNHSISEQNRSS